MNGLLLVLATQAHAACTQPSKSLEVAAQVTADGKPPERGLPPAQRPKQRPLGAAAMGFIPGLGHLHTCDRVAGVTQGVPSAALMLMGQGLSVVPNPIGTPLAFSATHTGRSLAWFSSYDAYRTTKMQRGPKEGATTVDGASLKTLALSPFRLENIRSPATLLAGGMAVALVSISATASGPLPWPDRVVWSARELRPVPAMGLGTAWAGFTVANVAYSEEALFRGVVQPVLVDAIGRPWLGMTLSNAIFGMAHFDFEDPQTGAIRASYIALGSFDLAVSAHKHGYDLGRPIAAHFWYDTILFVGALAIDPATAPWELAFTVPI
jgi:membrane protease YdiL (CAAX protease family)